MPYRIGSSAAALPIHRFLSKAQRDTTQALNRMASGSRIVSAGDDAAGFAISESLRGQINGITQARNNAENAQAMIQTAEGGLNEQTNILIRMRELAVQSASDTIGDEERGFVNGEFQLLKAEFDRIAKATRFGQKQLLTGTGEQFEFHVGPNKDESNIIRFQLDATSTADAVGIEGLDISDQDDASDALDSIDEANLKVAGARASLGGAQSRFQFTIDHLSAQHENLSKAHSIITDVDIAEEASRLARAKVVEEVGTSVLAQANMSPSRVLKLIG